MSARAVAVVAVELVVAVLAAAPVAALALVEPGLAVAALVELGLAVAVLALVAVALVQARRAAALAVLQGLAQVPVLGAQPVRLGSVGLAVPPWVVAVEPVSARLERLARPEAQ